MTATLQRRERAQERGQSTDRAFWQDGGEDEDEVVDVWDHLLCAGLDQAGDGGQRSLTRVQFPVKATSEQLRGDRQVWWVKR